MAPYNLNIAYCYDLFMREVLPEEASNPLKEFAFAKLPESATDEEKWKAFVSRCLLDPKGGAYVTAAVLREGCERLEPYMRSYGPEEKAAMLVTYFKQGPETMWKNYQNRVAQEKGPSDMLPGEGANLFYNMGIIREVLRGERQTREVLRGYWQNDEAPLGALR